MREDEVVLCRFESTADSVRRVAEQASIPSSGFSWRPDRPRRIGALDSKSQVRLQLAGALI